MLLPHEFVAHLYRSDEERFNYLMGTDRLVTYWDNVRRAMQPWFRDHPARPAIEATRGRFHIPFRIFGDEAVVGKHTVAKILHWVPLLSHETSTRLARIPIYAQSTAKAIDHCTDFPLLENTTWSFNAMAHGVFPPFPDTASVTKQRKSLVGQRICGKWVFTFAEFAADWKASVEIFHLPWNYSTEEICHMCGACKSGELDYMRFGINSLCHMHPRSTHAYLASRNAALSPLSKLEGFHLDIIGPEVMHAGPLGMSAIACGSALSELCSERCFGWYREIGEWAERLRLQLQVAFIEFVKWQATHNRRCTQKRFTPARLCLKRKVDAPILKAKAYNCIVVSEWLSDVCMQQHRANPTNSYIATRALTMWGFAEFYRILRESGDWFTEAQLEQLQVARNSMLFGYASMNACSVEGDKSLWTSRPKLHMLDHAIRRAQHSKRNPARQWTFQEEDNMGLMVKICAKCSATTLEARSVERWLLQFFQMGSPGDAPDTICVGDHTLLTHRLALAMAMRHTALLFSYENSSARP